MNKENEQKFKEIFNKSVDRLLDTLNNNPDELFDIKNLSKQLADKSRQIYNLTKENTNLKQVLNEIKEYINSWDICTPANVSKKLKDTRYGNHILQIIDKYKKEDD